jgi:two-component system cell cycle sensor histidine kinase/response regulator CckA
MVTQADKRRVRVLHLEDNENDHILVAETLSANELICEFTLAKSREEFEVALRRAEYDLIISDFTLPSYDGLTALSLAREVRPETPFVFFSGSIGEDIAVDSLQHGAVDYVLKQRPSRLVPAIRRALHNAQEHARLRLAEQIIREQGALLDKASDAILVCHINGQIIYWNKGAEKIYGWTAGEVLGKNVLQLLFKGILTPQVEEFFKSLAGSDEWSGELQKVARDGRRVTVQARSTLIRDEHGHPKSLLIINTDITEKKQLEEQFFRTQRLESLGVLVSGIAHDLNNALTPILIGANILRGEELSPQSESILDTMESSAKRGAEMVRQVLAFARGSDSGKAVIRVDRIVKEMGKIITDTFPKNIECHIEVDENCSPVSGAPTQLHQILMNLCVNARDAMPDGGKLALATKNIRLDTAEAAKIPGAKPGNYLCVSVADTGSGIPAEQLEKIFQPFFTTKSSDKGTGLGLSTSLSIAKNHGGFMTVKSEVGCGTEFNFFLPAIIGTVEGETIPEKPSLPAGNGECILIIDDEEAMLALVRTTLENYHYRVIATASGPEAVVRLAEKKGDVSLVITDIEMPFMDGFATINALRKIKHSLKIIVATGSKQENAVNNRGLNTDGFLLKPFTTEKLLAIVHEVLARKK